VLAALAAVLIALLGGWFWLRDSSLVGVKRVTVVGARGPDASQIRSALIAAGRKMTTLDVQTSRLRAAVSRFAVVKDLRIATHFPHGLKIQVVEQIPVAMLVGGDRRIAVAGNGTLLRDVRPSPSLPAVSVQALPSGSRLTNRVALAAITVLGAAPYQLLAHVDGVTDNAAHGVVVNLRHGPSLYFGDPTLLGSKWTAAADVLADPGSAGASYIDLVNPERPAAGTAGPTASSTPAASTAVTGASPSVAAASPALAPSGAGSPSTSSPSGGG
jgi:cell division protein FtsQ